MLTSSILSILPLLALGIMIMLWGVYILFSSKSTSNWPSTEGTIVKSEVKFESHASGENTEIMKCMPEINYEYSVGEQTHSSTSISQELPSFDRLGVQEVVDTYKAGDKIEVFYDPKNPSKAVLETKSSSFGYFVIVLGFIVAVLPIVKMLFGCCSLGN